MDNEQNRSEPPTSFKLRRARKKGVVARGSDLGFFAALASLLAFGLVAGGNLLPALAQAMRGSLMLAARAPQGQDELLAVIGVIGAPLASPLIQLAITIALGVLFLELIQTGFVFSTHPLKPDFNRLNPAEGLKRLLSIRLLIETVKSVAKLVIYASVAFLFIRAAVDDWGRAMRPAVVVDAILADATRLVAAFAGLAFVFMLADQLLVRGQFRTRMRMSRRELKREFRDREGEPRIKQRRRELHRQFAKARASVRGVRDADMLIVNPTHVAVGLRYRPDRMIAPEVVAAGADHLAVRLRRLALLYGVHVFEDAELARALYAGSGLNRAIRPECYRAVAALYNRTQRQQT